MTNPTLLQLAGTPINLAARYWQEFFIEKKTAQLPKTKQLQGGCFAH